MSPRTQDPWLAEASVNLSVGAVASTGHASHLHKLGMLAEAGQTSNAPQRS